MPDTHPRLRLFAAGSLRAALTAFVAAQSDAPEMVFGPAGLLRERIENGDVPDVFLSANLEHPAALCRDRPGSVVQPFARNALVAVARRELGLTTADFLDTLLRDGVRVGMSTPGLDPSGDYAERLFQLAEMQRPGAYALLSRRARSLVGGRVALDLPTGGSPVHWFLASGEVDVFLSYLTSAAALARTLDVVPPPASLTVSAIYSLVVLATDPDRQAVASAFAADIVSGDGQAMLRRHKFLAPPAGGGNAL